ncbi:glycine--tRNA ligase subunit beta [Asticcacaulis sp. EMRT-3]|uniref:glycine--tRNA ligase subunit beta n=1 Tax=Asticcacaulis sp. EMRT-3 TaxID=3040349 RepID=UPI0024AFD514|nr:glycine--tRNA ligase subunit beta [Asticcacaulis sp. EMRT-3]MDI7774240.1 glycine--tRNA ligase subunit beta [Asticcacaulis sp. EMRT-3]
MAQLLIELFSEEIPARMQLGAAMRLVGLFAHALKEKGLAETAVVSEHLKVYVTPRRLTLVGDNLPVEQPSITEEVKGPKEGAPEQAMAGFLRKVGLTQDQLVLENGVWMAKIHKPGRRTVEVLPDMLRDVILSFPWPKSMRSGTSSFRWVRPLKRILFLFDGAVVPFELEGLTASNLTEGHRFLGSGKPLAVSDFASYEKALRENFVILDHAERQTVILSRAHGVCEAAGCELIEDQGLLEEVAGLNEWPVPLLGDMDPAFLTLPPEVIKTSMRTHQKYFAVRRKAADVPPPSPTSGDTSPASRGGEMAPKFVITANMQAVDGGEEIKRGNAKVLSARLSDGVFFWKEDNRAGNFDQWLTKLEGSTFHVKLGTMKQRVERIVALAAHLAPLVGADADRVAQAARLAKADLASYMVGEFPELQGVMGGYYADAAGLDAEVADAIRQHYKPQGPTDTLPQGKVGAVVALADKLDTLVGFFAIGEKPTGSKDPYALRRSALGILRILRDQNVKLELLEITRAWYRNLKVCAIPTGELGYGIRAALNDQIYAVGPSGNLPDGAQDALFDEKFSLALTNGTVEIFKCPSAYGRTQKHIDYAPNTAEYEVLSTLNKQDEVAYDLLDFFNDRLKVQLRDEGHAPDVLEAVFALKDDDVLRLTKKLDGLEAVLTSSDGENLLQAHKRAANILAAAKWTAPATAPIASAQAEPMETALAEALKQAQTAVATALAAENYAQALQTIAALRQNIDSFLDGVLVNAEDATVRAARLNLLAGVCALSADIADLSRIV